MKRRKLTEEEKILIENWAANLPPNISRRAARYFLGGAVSPNVLCNNDSAGTGPLGAFRLGRDIMYPARELLVWLVEKRGIAILTSLRSLDGVIELTGGKAVPLPPWHPTASNGRTAGSA
jgi:hypothetical protein